MPDEEQATTGCCPCDAKAMEKFPCYRMFSFPLGLILVSLLALPCYFFMFLFLGLYKGMLFAFYLLTFNCGKFNEEMTSAFHSKEGFAACCVCCNTYTLSFLATLGVNFLLVPFFIIGYPIIGAGHATVMLCKEVFIDCEFAQLSRPDKGSWFAAAVDYVGITDSDKEKWAESVGSSCCGYMLLVLGDTLTLTGLPTAITAFMEGYAFHEGILDFSCSILSKASDFESIGFDAVHVEFDVVSPGKIAELIKNAVDFEFKKYAIKKGFKDFTEWTQKSSFKKYNRMFGGFYGVICAVLAGLIYAGVPVMIVAM